MIFRAAQAGKPRPFDRRRSRRTLRRSDSSGTAADGGDWKTVGLGQPRRETADQGPCLYLGLRANGAATRRVPEGFCARHQPDGAKAATRRRSARSCWRHRDTGRDVAGTGRPAARSFPLDSFPLRSFARAAQRGSQQTTELRAEIEDSG